MSHTTLLLDYLLLIYDDLSPPLTLSEDFASKKKIIMKKTFQKDLILLCKNQGPDTIVKIVKSQFYDFFLYKNHKNRKNCDFTIFFIQKS